MNYVKGQWPNTAAAAPHPTQSPLVQCPPAVETIFETEECFMNRQDTEKLRQRYIQNPPEGMTADEIRSMSANDLLDMDYFLNEEDFDLGEEGEESFYIF